jgi:2-haloalkanoic acid dehalogenase type II
VTRPFDIITFDCYGTLVDWNAGITGAFRDAAAREGVTLDAEALLQAYHEVEPAVQRAAYRPYRDVLADVASGCAERLGWPLDPGRSAFLAESLGGWMPFPDANPMLERLAAMGFELGILSNIDEDLFAETRRHLTVSFDLVVTAEQVRSYKPHHGHFLAARTRIGDGRWLHAAQSYFHDIVPARALDIPVVWVNRDRSPPSGPERPDAEVESLEGLVNWLEAGAVPQARP